MPLRRRRVPVACSRRRRSKAPSVVADTLRRELAESPILWKGEHLDITASFGVATAGLAELDTKAFISRADAALYQAKEGGRNCVRLSVEAAVA